MNRTNIIQALLNTCKNKNYLEIGVADGVNFAEIFATYKHGVDPVKPSPLVENIISDNFKYFQMPSDDFFSKKTIDKLNYDVVFIDGLHEYEQAYRDIVNALNYLAVSSGGGCVVVHDCIPPNAIAGLPPTEYQAINESLKEYKNGLRGWTGDVWKAILRVRSLHSDLYVITLDCDWGVAIITKGKPESMLAYSLEDIKKMDFNDFRKNKTQFLNLKSNSFFINFLESHRNIEIFNGIYSFIASTNSWDSYMNAENRIFALLSDYLKEPERSLVKNGFMMELNKICESMMNTNKQLLTQLDKYETSSSWRITAPLRAIKRWIK